MGGAILGLTGPIIAVLALTSGFTAWENCRSGLLQMQLLQPPEAAAGQQQAENRQHQRPRAQQICSGVHGSPVRNNKSAPIYSFSTRRRVYKWANLNVGVWI